MGVSIQQENRRSPTVQQRGYALKRNSSDLMLYSHAADRSLAVSLPSERVTLPHLIRKPRIPDSALPACGHGDFPNCKVKSEMGG